MSELQEFIAGILNKVSHPLLWAAFALGGYSVYEISVEDSPLNKKIAAVQTYAMESRHDFYYTQMYDIMKQTEKLERDPTDIKKTDLDKLQRICSNEDFVDFVKSTPGEPFTALVGTSCTLISKSGYNRFISKIDRMYSTGEK